MSYVQPTQGAQGRASGPRAGFWQRFGASLTDGIIVGIINIVIEIVLRRGAGALTALVFTVAYFVFQEGGPRGQTLGKRAIGIRVISLDTGGPIGYGRAFVRYIGHIVSFIFVFLGYFWMLWDSEKQCWHDKFAGDVVVPLYAYPIN